VVVSLHSINVKTQTNKLRVENTKYFALENVANVATNVF